MRTSNAYDLPEAMYTVLSSSSRKPERRRYHVTQLIGSPLQRVLMMKYWDELEEDASDRLWALLGSSVHYILHKGAPAESIAEELMQLRMGDVVLLGTSDLYHNRAIEDYKVTSVFSFLLGDKPEWERQENVYAPMLRAMGFPVDKLFINAILRDWVKSKALREPGYPPIPFQRVSVPLWSPEKALSYIAERVALHRAAEDAMDAPCCTDEERWTRPTTYAVTKKGNKRAARVLDSEEAAEKWADKNMKGKPFDIETRPGGYIKCADYCPVRSVCPYNVCATSDL